MRSDEIDAAAAAFKEANSSQNHAAEADAVFTILIGVAKDIDRCASALERIAKALEPSHA